MPSPAMDCGGCSLSFQEVIAQYTDNDEGSIAFLQRHGVLPVKRSCEKCGKECKLRKDRYTFVCDRQRTNKKTKRVQRCAFSSSLLKGTFLGQTHLSPSTALLFFNIYLRKYFSQLYCIENLNLASHTVVKWRALCGGVCERWVKDKGAIGGPGVIVEIGVEKFGKGSKNREREADGAWVFGGIERDGNSFFLVPVADREGDTLLPLCQKYLKEGTKVHSDGWRGYEGLEELGYDHITSKDSDIHTDHIERVWQDIRVWALKAGQKEEHYERYFARYLFLHCHSDHRTVLHHFLRQVAHCYPPPP